MARCRIFLWSFIGVAIAAFAALVVVQPVVTAGPSSAAYFPLTAGTVWTYRTNTQGDITVRVGRASRVGAADCRLVETVVAGDVSSQECYRAQNDGVYVLARTSPKGSAILEPPQRLLASPVAVGQKWQWRGRAGPQDVTFFYTWAREETVTVPAGTFRAMQLYFEGVPGPQVRIQSWRWFAPNVGMVKEDTVLTQGNQTTRVYSDLVRVTMGK